MHFFRFVAAARFSGKNFALGSPRSDDSQLPRPTGTSIFSSTECTSANTTSLTTLVRENSHSKWSSFWGLGHLLGADYTNRLYVTIGLNMLLASVCGLYLAFTRRFLAALSAIVLVFGWLYMGVVNSVV
jgi:hypothetical protein